MADDDGRDPADEPLDFNPALHGRRVDPRVIAVDDNPHIRPVGPVGGEEPPEDEQAEGEVQDGQAINWQGLVLTGLAVLITLVVLVFCLVLWTSSSGLVWKLAAGVCPIVSIITVVLAWFAFGRNAQNEEDEDAEEDAGEGDSE